MYGGYVIKSIKCIKLYSTFLHKSHNPNKRIAVPYWT